MNETTRNLLRLWIPKPVLNARVALYQTFLADQKTAPLDWFLYKPHSRFGYAERKALVDRIVRIHAEMRCAHTHEEIIQVLSAILALPESAQGVIVEAGCFKGGSTAKLSIAAKMTNRKLVVFDSFEGIPTPPAHESDVPNVLNREGVVEHHIPGNYAGGLEEVKENVRRYGEIEVCEFVQGWFDQTMPTFKTPVATAFVDVDLQASEATCFTHLYPLLVPGQSIFSHDGHLAPCVALMDDPEFWKTVDAPAPKIHGLRTKKLVRVQKPAMVP